jgi:Mg2+/Co2+ transporter CorB
MENRERLLITILIGNNLVNITSSGVLTVMIAERFGDVAIAVASGALTFLILTFGEILPKTIDTSRNVSIALTVAFPFLVMQRILFPISYFFEILAKCTQKLVSQETNSAKESEDELMSMVTIAHQKGELEDHEKMLIQNVFKLNDIKVKKAMTSKPQIFSLEANLPVKSIIKEIKEHHYSKVTVYHGDLDNIVGFLFVKDLAVTPSRELNNKVVKDFVRDVIYVNEDEILSNLYDVL